MTVHGAQATGVATALQDAATALLRSARRAKKAEAAHRRSARESMQALDRLRIECERVGIRLDVVAPKESPDDDDHGG